jgi:hypothetical protein
MNHNFKKLIGAALMSGLGLCTVAMSAHASPIAQFGESVQVFNNPGSLNVLAVYANVAGNFSSSPGITLTSNDPNAVLNYSPNPALQTGGLTNGTLDLTSGSGVANVSGNLATGATHIFSSTSAQNGPITESSTITNVGAMDGLTFSVAGGGSANVTLTYSLDGNLSTNNTGSYSAEIKYFLGSADMDWTGATGSGVGTGETSGFTSFTYTNNTISGFQFQGTFSVTDGEALPLFFSQEMNCNTGSVCDFQNTGQMGLILPAGTSFTSNSGVFLTQQDGASTPEPGSLLLIGLGMGAIAGLRCRRPAR